MPAPTESTTSAIPSRTSNTTAAIPVASARASSGWRAARTRSTSVASAAPTSRSAGPARHPARVFSAHPWASISARTAWRVERLAPAILAISVNGRGGPSVASARSAASTRWVGSCRISVIICRSFDGAGVIALGEMENRAGRAQDGPDARR